MKKKYIICRDIKNKKYKVEVEKLQFRPAVFGIIFKGNCILSTLIYYLCKNPKGKISTEHFDENEEKYMSAAEWVNLRNVKKLKFYNAIDSPRLIREAYRLYKGD